MEKYSRIKACISLDAIAHNFQAMRDNINDDTKMIAVIKADGYGHGAVPIAHMAETYPYIWGFATATVEEAVALRKSGIRKPILILGYSFPESYEELINYEIRCSMFQVEAAEKLSETAVRLGKKAYIHLALDTGMSRIGFADEADSVIEILKIAAMPGIEIEGLFTHFARADEADPSPAYEQLTRYHKFVEMLGDEGVTIPLKHCSNSAGIIRMREANLDAVRAGISIYGIYPSDEVERDRVLLQPAMELKTHITYIKTVQAGTGISYGATFVTEDERRVATIPVGYADGYPRALSNRGWVLIHGKKAPVLGRVCMDQFMVDVTDIPEAQMLDEVTLLGRDCDAEITADELGTLSGRFNYELVCDISKRVPRVYEQAGREVAVKYWD